MISYLLHASISMVIFYLIYLMLLSRESFFRLNRFYLLFTLLLSLIIPVLALHMKDFVMQDLYMVRLPEISITATGVNDEGTQTAANKFDWRYFLFGLYFTGVLLGSITLTLAFSKILMIIYKGKKEDKNDYTLVSSDSNISIFSFFHYLVVPSSMGELHPHILRHEMVHIRQYHTMDMLLMEIMKIIFWFNPVVYAIRREMKILHEYEADVAFKNKEEVNVYVHILLDGLERSFTSFSLSNNFYNSLIKKRIYMLHKKESSMTNRWKYLMLIPATLVLISAIQSRDISNAKLISVRDISTFTDTVPTSPPSPPAPPQVRGTNVTRTIKGTDEIIAPPSPPSPPSPSKDMEIFKIVEEMPRFPGCEEIGSSNEEKEKCSKLKLLEFVYQNLKYPESARENGVQGTVVTQFIVDKNGGIIDLEIVRDIGAGCGEAVYTALYAMVNEGIKWIPGKQRGKNVNVLYTLPVKFKLDDE
jgi:TonB family protein